MREGLKTILQAIDYVKNGISICIFPEGTRNNGEELSMLPFRDGALKIAEKTGCAIIPISMNNTADIFEAHFPRVKKYMSSSNTANQSIQKNWIKRQENILESIVMILFRTQLRKTPVWSKPITEKRYDYAF